MPAVSIPGMYKEAIEAAMPAFVDKVWRRDHLPDDEPLPYVTIFDGIGDAPRMHGDGYGIGWVRLVQVDLWEDSLAQDDVTYLQLVDVLDGLVLGHSPGFAPLSSVVDSTVRLPDEEAGIAHTSLTCRVMHVRTPAVVP